MFTKLVEIVVPRGAKPGERRGGRCKGRPNKRTMAVADKLEALSCGAIKRMARIVMDETAELCIRAQMYKELAQYIASKRKAIEGRGEVGQSFINAIRKASSRRDTPDHDV
jgi:hypothetical protein